MRRVGGGGRSPSLVEGRDGGLSSSGLGVMSVVVLKVDVDVARPNGPLACHVKHLVLVMLGCVI